jgi:putative restriction endonuclease
MSLQFQEAAARVAVFQWLEKLAVKYADALPRTDLERGCPFASATGGSIQVISPQGIFKPKDFSLPLSITPSPNSPYADSFSGGMLTYKYRGQDPQHPDNIGLRKAMQQQVPMVYFHGVIPGKYVASWPVFIRGDNPAALVFTAAVDDHDHVALIPQGSAEDDLRQRYATRLVRQRLHQSLFRARVIQAYRTQCAMCRLKHEGLLDAAHIVADSEEGPPVIRNGLSLCKIHYAIFDQLFVSITPDYQVRARPSILAEEDGPMLEHGLKKLEGTKIVLPSSAKDRPDRDGLAKHYELFLKAA